MLDYLYMKKINGNSNWYWVILNNGSVKNKESIFTGKKTTKSNTKLE